MSVRSRVTPPGSTYSSRTEEEIHRSQSQNLPDTTEAKVDPLWTILPSYQMYYSLYRGIRMSDDDDGNEDLPPVYHRNFTSASSLVSDPTYHSGTPMSSQETTATRSIASGNSFSPQITDGSRFIFADELSNWQETILDNTHLLKNLTGTTNYDSNAISIEIHFTKDICQPGEEPVEIDPTFFEYKQDDYVNGYIIIKNTSDKPIPFEMFYLVFEGTMKIVDMKTKKYIHSRNFLQMFDFSGSWKDGHINRLITESENSLACHHSRDPRDGTYLSFACHKEIVPNRTYKRFFTFKVPNFLLDTECSEHNLSTHIQLPPSMGCSTFEKPGDHTMPVQDFTPQNSAITYGVLARFVGRKSRHNVDESLFKNHDMVLVNSKGDEFLILKEEYSHVRILQQTNVLVKNTQKTKFMETKLMYDNLRNKICERLEFGKQLRESLINQQFDNSFNIAERISQLDRELSKKKQYYQSGDGEIKYTHESLNEYVFNYPLTKKSLSGATKQLGTIQFCTPKREYSVKYIPPIQFRQSPLSEEDLNSWKLELPLQLTYTFPPSDEQCDSKKIPKIKSFFADLVVLTIKSENYSIPIEFHHDLIFQESTNTVQQTSSYQDSDTFEENIVVPMRILANELFQLSKELGDNFKIEKHLIDDMRSICELESKNHHLWIRDTKVKTETEITAISPKTVNSIPWKFDGKQYSRNFNIILNLESAMLNTALHPKKKGEAYDRFCLVPNFQYCRIARMYFIRISIGLSNNQMIRFKIPVSILK